MQKTVLVDRREGYAILTLNRPEALNALSKTLRDELHAAVAEIDDDPIIRVLIVTGAGRAFCAGLDLKEIGKLGLPKESEGIQDPVVALRRFRGPVIAAVNGVAITGGFELALACDVILAGQSARFADTHARVGVLPGWGLSQRLSRLIGEYRAKELSLTGRFLTADEAERWGLANRVVADDALIAEAEEMAKLMLSTAPGMAEQLKALIDDGFLLPLGEALALETRRSHEFASAVTPADLAGRREGVRAAGRSATS